MNQYQTIDEYLRALRLAFGDAPAGLVADALADAQEHLRNWLAAHPGQSEADAIKSYGTAADVAAEYLASEIRPASRFAPPPPQAVSAAVHRPHPGLFAVVKDPVTYGALLYMLLSCATGVLYFTWSLTGIALSLGLAILIIGLPFFLAFVGSVRVFSYIEGRLVEVLLGVRMPRRLPAPPRQLLLRQRIMEALADMRTWSSMVYMLLMLPLGIVYFTIAAVGVAVPVLLFYFGGWYMFFMRSIVTVTGDDADCTDCTGFSLHEDGGGLHLHNSFAWLDPFVNTPIPGLVMILVAVLVFFTVLHLARLIGWLHGRFAERLLVRL